MPSAAQPPAAPGGPSDGDLNSAIGAAVRARRESAGLSMRALAAEAGVSQPFLSQLERGLVAASIATLHRLATALAVPPGALLSPGPTEVVVVRSDEGVRIPVGEEARAAVGRVVVGPDGRMSLTEYRVAPGERLDSWFETDTDITLHVISGHLEVEMPGVGDWRLGPGDTMLHSGRLRRRWRQVGSEPTHLVVVAAGPG
ncbi:helix-turn-helix domain-containing protein [Nakamurella flava]|uniref:helix-turn-helix domain-containing protein n=1 Tax=Nakamurella flava TaxID=2576308 RepID=UPI00197CA426|nr:XRE family transcriptional regulator [Nakamurella flava]